ncbi:unnamed protein product [Bursaphelenchus xylophilus]|uniref:(pine wood nematode) hypothetical protein n=1 Tax=Bursaphelenchus xylophilus TaxID=6326 RepID=A0A1I7RZ10_BURXY|nr:unnamed protein product [Bursaphelenchus xylophilus]CAG9106969.1 unnamed protein product [Bursaphelenchus xylophilus]
MNLNNNESLITSKMNGITVDDMNSLRIGDPEVTEMSIELQKLCDQFTHNVGELQGRLSDVQEVFRELGELADREKIIAMNTANELKMIQSNQDSSKDTMRIQASIQEKAVELEHAKRQLENLKQIEAKQTEYIRKLHLLQ